MGPILTLPQMGPILTLPYMGPILYTHKAMCAVITNSLHLLLLYYTSTLSSLDLLVTAMIKIRLEIFIKQIVGLRFFFRYQLHRNQIKVYKQTKNLNQKHLNQYYHKI